MKIEFINDELHAEENLTRLIKATTDKDLVSFQHFLAFETASGAVKVTNPIIPSEDDSSVFFYELTADLIPSRGYLTVQLIASDGSALNPKVIKSDVFTKYIKPSIHIPEEEDTPNGQYISVFTLSQRLDTLEDNIGQVIKEYIKNNPIPALNISFDNEGTDITSSDVQGALVELAQRGGTGIPVFIIDWKVNPTTEQKQYIVDQFTAMAQIGGHRYIVRLKVGSDVLDGVIYGNNKATFFDFGSGTAVPKVYTISASSVEAYNQTSEYFYNTILFDENSDIPASQAVITDYINGKLSTALGSVETALETLTTGGGVA